jgi:hypothetical protein
MARLAVVWLLSVVCVAPCCASSDEIPTVQLSHDQAVALVAQWLVTGDLKNARALVGLLEREYPDDLEVSFLAAQTDISERDYASAIRRLRKILSSDPSLVRVRLDLARALFLAGEYASARYHFEFALGGDLPPAARENIQHYLQIIEAQKSSFDLTVLVGPDTNPNYASTANSITLFGIDYKLNPEAQARRAIGVQVTGTGRKAFGDEDRSFLSAYFELRDFPGSYADFDYVQVTAGRNFLSGNSVWSLEAGPLGSLYQGRELYTGATLTASHSSPLGSRLTWSEFANVKRLNYSSDFSYLTATQTWVGATLKYPLSGTTVLWGTLAPGLNLAEQSPYSYWAIEASVGCTTELPRRINVEARVAFDGFYYDAAQPLFDVSRQDQLIRVDLSITARDWAIHGFAPKLTAGLAWNHSNIPLYEYTRGFLGVGVTKRF